MREAEWTDAKRKYVAALKGGKGYKQILNAFTFMHDHALAVSGVDFYRQRLAQAERDLVASAEALRPPPCNAFLHQRRSNMVAPALLASAVSPRPREGGALVAPAQAALTRNAWRAAKEAALDRYERAVGEAVVASLPKGVPVGELPSLVLSVMARAMTAHGELERARLFYDRASLQERNIPMSAWYRLEALNLEAMGGARAAEGTIPKIQKIREGLALLRAQALMLRAQQKVKEPTGEGGPLMEDDGALPLEVGKPEQILELEAFSWKILYESLQVSLGDASLSESAVRSRLEEIAALEEERRQIVKARKGRAGEAEVQLHLHNMQLAAAVWTQKNGTIEHGLRSEGPLEADRLHAQLASDAADLRELARPFLVRAKGEWIFEQLATLDWRASVDAFRNRDLPKNALEAASGLADRWRDSRNLQEHLGALRREAEEAKVAGKLFKADGTLNPLADLSASPEGVAAGERATSAYWWMSSSVGREAGLPLAGGVACSGLAYFLGWTGVGSLVTGAACALGAAFGNRTYNTRVIAAEQYRQAKLTGLSRLGADEARRNRDSWYFGTALMGATFLLPGTGEFSAGVGRFAFASALRVAALPTAGAAALRFALHQPARNTLQAAGAALREALTGVRTWFAKGHSGISLGDARLAAGLLLWIADATVIDKEGNLVGGDDGGTDHWTGHVGQAAIWSGLAYQGFRLTWRQKAKQVLFEDGSVKAMVGLGEQLRRQPWRAWIVRAGADAVMADYFLVREVADEGKKAQWAWVDFGAKRGTPREERAFARQFGIDTALGYAGLPLMFGDWAVTEYRTLPMYMTSNLRVTSARARVLIGGGLVVADLIEDGDLNRWYLGGIGGATLMNEAGSAMLEVDAWGSMVATGFRVLQEWLLQWQQEMPIQAPDAKRLMWASAESTAMRFPAKAFMMGEPYLRTFPFGRRMLEAHGWMNDPARPAWLRAVGAGFRPIERLSGPPKLRQGAAGWRAEQLTDHHKYRPLVYVPNGSAKAARAREEAPEDLHLSFQLKMQRGADGKRSEHVVFLRSGQWKPPGGAASLAAPKVVQKVFGGEVKVAVPVAHLGDPQYADAHALLRANGHYASGGRLFRLTPQFEGAVRALGERYTAKDLDHMQKREREQVVRQLNQEERIIYRRLGSIKDPEVKSVIIAQMKQMGLYDSAAGDKQGVFVKRWRQAVRKGGAFVIDPKVDKFAREMAIPPGDEVKVISIPAGDGDFSDTVTILLERRFVVVPSGEIGGTKRIVFTGSKERPRLKVSGILPQGILMSGTAYLANEYVFRRMMDGDPQYQKMQRVFNYGVSEFLTHPLVQWPLGYDKPLAQLAGRSIGMFIVNPLGNELFPTYLNTWPGLPSYYDRLDRVPQHPFAASLDAAVDALKPGDQLCPGALQVFANTMSSTQVDPLVGAWGTAEGGTRAYYEPRALETFQAVESCIRSRSLGIEDTQICDDLPPKTLKSLKREMKAWENRVKFQGQQREGAVPAELEVELQRRRNIELANEFRSCIEEERSGTLSEIERRALIIMAAHIKKVLRDVSLPQNRALEPAYQPLRDLQRRYEVELFGDIPSLDGERWHDFLKAVNLGRSPASNFHFKLKKDRAAAGESGGVPARDMHDVVD